MARTNKKWPELQEFMNKNKHLLIVIADPMTDEMCISFQERNGFVRFPSKDMLDGVIFNALRESKWAEAIDPFIAGVVKCTGMDVSTSKAANEVMSALGGGMKTIGTPKSSERSRVEILPKRSKKK